MSTFISIIKGGKDIKFLFLSYLKSIYTRQANFILFNSVAHKQRPEIPQRASPDQPTILEETNQGDTVANMLVSVDGSWSPDDIRPALGETVKV